MTPRLPIPIERMFRSLQPVNYRNTKLAYCSPKRHIRTVQRPYRGPIACRSACWFSPVAVKRRAVGVIYGIPCLFGHRDMVRCCVNGRKVPLESKRPRSMLSVLQHVPFLGKSKGLGHLNYRLVLQHLTSEIIYRLWKITRVFTCKPLFQCLSIAFKDLK